jgi:hypothetical protein
MFGVGGWRSSRGRRAGRRPRRVGSPCRTAVLDLEFARRTGSRCRRGTGRTVYYVDGVQRIEANVVISAAGLRRGAPRPLHLLRRGVVRCDSGDRPSSRPGRHISSLPTGRRDIATRPAPSLEVTSAAIGGPGRGAPPHGRPGRWPAAPAPTTASPTARWWAPPQGQARRRREDYPVTTPLGPVPAGRDRPLSPAALRLSTPRRGAGLVRPAARRRHGLVGVVRCRPKTRSVAPSVRSRRPGAGATLPRFARGPGPVPAYPIRGLEGAQRRLRAPVSGSASPPATPPASREPSGFVGRRRRGSLHQCGGGEEASGEPDALVRRWGEGGDQEAALRVACAGPDLCPGRAGAAGGGLGGRRRWLLRALQGEPASGTRLFRAEVRTVHR